MPSSTFYEEATREYAIWSEMIHSGAEVHEPWIRDFRVFLKDVGRCGLFGYKLFKLDPDGKYEPENVKWMQGEPGYVADTSWGKKRKKRALVQDIPFEVLAAAAKEAKNRSQLELKIYGANKSGRGAALQERCQAESINISHWTGRNSKRPWLAALKVKDLSTPNLRGLRRRILREKLLPYQCAKCGLLPVWEGRELTLHLDHTDGNRINCVLSNLRFLCPNCHQQTETWGNKRSRKLPPDTVIIELSRTLSRTEVAAMFNVHPSTISHVVRKYY